jgi:hypothetical protein
MTASIARHALGAVLSCCIVAWSAPASAAQRTFVASTGLDTDPCSINQPCRSFVAAMAQTDAGGEVVVLDSAGYGPVAIAQSVAILAAPGVYAGVTVFAGNGITISGVGSRVKLRGLTVNGQGGDIGIHFQQGTKLDVERCTVSGMNLYGLYINAANAAYVITDTTVRDNASYGILIESGSGTLDRVRAESNVNVGVQINTSSGVLVRALIRDSVASANSGHGFAVFSGSGRTALVTIENSGAFDNSGSGFAGATSGGTTVLTVHQSVATQNTGSGVLGSGSGATVVVTADTLARNSNFGMELTSAAIVRSLQNNTVEDNVSGSASPGITNGTLI